MKISIIFSLLILVGIILTIFFVLFPGGETEAPPAPVLVGEEQAPIGNTEVTLIPENVSRVNLQTETGYSVSARDFRAIENVNNMGADMYHFQGSEVGRPYSIIYNPGNNSFAIALESYPLEETREIASVGFLRLLDISQNDACALNVFVSVPADLSPRFAGEDLGLSFCSDRRSL